MPTYLDCSTAHIKQETLAELGPMLLAARQARGWPAMDIAHYEHGCFITVPEDTRISNTMGLIGGMPQDLATLLQYASIQGHQLIRLDADGDWLPDLPTYKRD